jgi:light-harvesting complex II chlorophyll a/b binding protein 5
MIAMLGVFVQGATTAEGPAANWGKHVADPFGYNFVTIAGVDRTPVL